MMDNLSAFPIAIDFGDVVKYQDGMTLRDYFAAKASEADIAEYMPETLEEAKLYPNRTRQWARYQHADAMLKAREA
jgi:hypothetical protein